MTCAKLKVILYNVWTAQSNKTQYVFNQSEKGNKYIRYRSSKEICISRNYMIIASLHVKWGGEVQKEPWSSFPHLVFPGGVFVCICVGRQVIKFHSYCQLNFIAVWLKKWRSANSIFLGRLPTFWLLLFCLLTPAWLNFFVFIVICFVSGPPIWTVLFLNICLIQKFWFQEVTHLLNVWGILPISLWLLWYCDVVN